MLFSNILLIPAAVWVVAQILKVVINLIQKREFNWRWLYETGGMPSCHTAFVVSLAAVIALDGDFGLGSAEFAIAFVLMMVVIIDAFGVRHHAGEQASILNRMIDHMPKEKREALELHQTRLKEEIGHEPIEVLAGIALGIAVTWVLVVITI